MVLEGDWLAEVGGVGVGEARVCVSPRALRLLCRRGRFLIVWIPLSPVLRLASASLVAKKDVGPLDARMPAQEHDGLSGQG